MIALLPLPFPTGLAVREEEATDEAEPAYCVRPSRSIAGYSPLS